MSDDKEIAKIVAELEDGEKTAKILETKLTSLETKIDDLLASCEETNLMTAELNNISQPTGSAKKNEPSEKPSEKKSSNEKKAEDSSQK